MILRAHMQQISETVKQVGDGLAVVSVVAAWANILSTVLTIIATLLTIAWTGIRLYDWWRHRRVSSDS